MLCFRAAAGAKGRICRGFLQQPAVRHANTGGMNAVITVGAVLCVPIIIVLTLEVEMRADRWLRKIGRLVTGR